MTLHLLKYLKIPSYQALALSCWYWCGWVISILMMISAACALGVDLIAGATAMLGAILLCPWVHGALNLNAEQKIHAAVLSFVGTSLLVMGLGSLQVSTDVSPYHPPCFEVFYLCSLMFSI